MSEQQAGEATGQILAVQVTPEPTEEQKAEEAQKADEQQKLDNLVREMGLLLDRKSKREVIRFCIELYIKHELLSYELQQWRENAAKGAPND